MFMIKLVLLRHGESIWNKENKFTGWTDVDLSAKGVKEAKEAGRTLKEKGYNFDIAFTSLLVRATRTLDLTLKEMNLDIPIEKSWRLNERHYGALQGLNKSEMAKKVGEKQVHIWRRSYDVRPPFLKTDDDRNPRKDQLYSNIEKKNLPLSECLKDTIQRVLPYWEHDIAPQLKLKKRVLVCAHGNSLRALVKYLDGMSDDEIISLNIPTGIALVYDLDEKLKPIKHYYLGNKQMIDNAINSVKIQGKK